MRWDIKPNYYVDPDFPENITCTNNDLSEGIL